MKNGAEFSDSFISNLLRIIQHMRPKKNKSTKLDDSPKDNLSFKFPGLAIPNEPQKVLSDEDDVEQPQPNIENSSETIKPTGPSSSPNKRQLSRSRSKSPERRRGNRSKEKDNRRHRNRSRSRNRNRSKDRRRSNEKHRSRERNRDRSRSNQRHKSRERNRNNSKDRRRSRDRNKKIRSKSCDRKERKRRDKSVEKKFKSDRTSPELDDEPDPGKVCII